MKYCILLLILAAASAPAASVILSEIMIRPYYRSAAGEDYASNEYVELYNAGDQAVDLRNWRLSDSKVEDLLIAAGAGTVLEAGRFAIIYPASYQGFYAKPPAAYPEALELSISGRRLFRYGLRDQYGSLLLVDSQDTVLDTFHWHAEPPRGAAWARQSPVSAQWYISHTPSPGFANPVWSSGSAGRAAIRIISQHCIIRAGAEDQPARFAIHVPQGSTFSAAIYSLDARPLLSLAAATLSQGAEIQLRWYGRDEEGRALNTGIYLLHVDLGAAGTSTHPVILAYADTEAIQ